MIKTDTLAIDQEILNLIAEERGNHEILSCTEELEYKLLSQQLNNGRQGILKLSQQKPRLILIPAHKHLIFIAP